MKKISIIIQICIFFIIPLPIFASTSTPSATPTNQSNQIDKLKSIVQEYTATTEAILQKEIISKSLVGYTGKVKSVGTKNLTLEIDGDLLQVSISATTSITKSNAEIKTTSIALADKLLVMGTKTKEGVLEAKRVIVIEEEKPENIVITKSYISQIKNIDLKKKTFILSIDSVDQVFTLSKKTSVKLEDYKDGDNIIAITKKYQGKYSLSRASKI